MEIRNLEHYTIDGNLLLYQHPNDGKKRLVLLNIKEIIEGLLYEYHDAECYEHPGIDRTARVVEKEYYWKHMIKSIRKYVKSCEVCQKNKDKKIETTRTTK